MTKSELIERIVTHQGQLSSRDVELAIKTMLEQMAHALAAGDRIEIRGFGSFSLHYRAPRVGRIPRPANRCIWMGNTSPTSSPARSCATASTNCSDASRSLARPGSPKESTCSGSNASW